MKKIEISKSELCRIVGEGGSFAGRSKVMPILDCVRIATLDGRIRVSSTDTKDYIKSYGVCIAADNMDFCIAAKNFTSYISSISDDIIVMKYDEEKHSLRINHSNGKIKFATVGSGEFPESPTFRYTLGVELPSAFLARWLSVASNFAQKTDGGSVLEGVHLRMEDGVLYVFGSDRNSIFIGMMPVEGIDDFNVTILPTGVSVLSKLVKNQEVVKLMWNDTRLVVKSDSFEMSTTLLSLNYPNLRKFLDMMGSVSFEIETEKLSASCKRIKTQLCEGHTNLRISHVSGILSLEYESIEYSKQLQEDIEVDGYDFGEMGVNINRLWGVLTSCATPSVNIYHVDNNRQPLFIESDFGDYKEIYGLSPMV